MSCITEKKSYKDAKRRLNQARLRRSSFFNAYIIRLNEVIENCETNYSFWACCSARTRLDDARDALAPFNDEYQLRLSQMRARKMEYEQCMENLGDIGTGSSGSGSGFSDSFDGYGWSDFSSGLDSSVWGDTGQSGGDSGQNNDDNWPNNEDDNWPNNDDDGWPDNDDNSSLYDILV